MSRFHWPKNNCNRQTSWLLWKICIIKVQINIWNTGWVCCCVCGVILFKWDRPKCKVNVVASHIPCSKLSSRRMITFSRQKVYRNYWIAYWNHSIGTTRYCSLLFVFSLNWEKSSNWIDSRKLFCFRIEWYLRWLTWQRCWTPSMGLRKFTFHRHNWLPHNWIHIFVDCVVTQPIDIWQIDYANCWENGIAQRQLIKVSSRSDANERCKTHKSKQNENVKEFKCNRNGISIFLF